MFTIKITEENSFPVINLNTITFSVTDFGLHTNPRLVEPLVGAVGGIPEPFELLEPMAGSAFVEPNSMGATGGPGGEIKIGSIRLQVVPGDITKENTDAIVNGTNPDLDMTQGTACY